MGPSSSMEAGGGAGGRGSPLLFGGGLQEAEEEQEETLVLYCGSEGEEEAAGGQKKARVAASLGLDQDFSERDSYGQDPLWLVSNTLQLNIQSEDDVSETVILADSEVVSEGGMLDGDALLLLNDSVNFLPISEGLPSSDKLLESIDTERQLGKMATPVKKSSVKPPSRASHTDYTSRERSKANFPSRSSPKMYSKGSQGEQAPIISAVSMASPVSGAMKEKTLVSGKENVTLMKNHQRIGTVVPSATSRTVLQLEDGVHRDPTMKFKLVESSKSSVDEDDQYEEPFVGPSLRWPSQPRSYRGAKQRDGGVMRKNVRKIIPGVDTDGETSGMGSSVDEPIESSTESASEAPVVTPSFLQPRPSSSSSRGPSTSPVAVKKRRGGWPKGRKRKPEIPGVKPPKAPLTAYVLFLNERRKYYKETRPELSFGAVTKLLGAEWSSLTPEQKAAFVTRSEQDKRRYRNELQAYRQSHDYQLLLRKKRIKNVIKRGGTTTEESSDFTDEIDDDDSEELYCRICDQLFTSLHNKREHLYGKQHLQAITGEYQRERLAEEERQMAATGVSQGKTGDCLNCGSLITTQAPSSRAGLRQLPPGVCPTCSFAGPTTNLASTKTSPRPHMEEEEHDGDEEDEEEEEEEDEEEEEADADEEGEVTEEEGNASRMCSMADALEGVMAKMLEREQEIKALKQSSEDARAQNLQLATALLQLREQEQQLDQDQEGLQEENNKLKAEADALWMLPALFGVTPLDMVNITLRQDQEEEEEESSLHLLDNT